MLVLDIDGFGKVELFSFESLSLEDLKTVLSMRNHSDVSKWMYGSGDISWENHKQFVETLKACSDKAYFLVKYKKVNIGVIYLTNIVHIYETTNKA